MAALALALVAGCDEDGDGSELRPDTVELRDDAEHGEKTETHNPPEPPPPPGPGADETDDLVAQGRPQRDRDVGPNDIQGRYIVRMRAGANPNAAAAAVNAVPAHVFSHAFHGFAGPLNHGQRMALNNRPDVVSVEPDQLVTTVATQTMDGAGHPSGLDRIDQTQQPLDRKYIYFRNARGVRVYVIDTGIQSNHQDFHNALAVFDAFGGNGRDCNGHGTHVAGTIGGHTHGVAKQAFLRGVRVLGCNGNGTLSGVIAGIDWVARNHVKPAVANLSLGGGRSEALNAAVDSLADAGVFVVVAAGNEGAPACNSSPASAAKVFTTAASDPTTDARASWSNYGECVDAYAPGVDIKSTWRGNSTRIISGTSMAAPHVAGAAALYKAVYGDVSWSTIKSNLLAWATRDVIVDNPAGTPNVLLFQPF
jgi:subtilisin family serine protease